MSIRSNVSCATSVSFADGMSILSSGRRAAAAAAHAVSARPEPAGPVNATIADGQGMATIIDDDTLLLLNQTSSTRGVAFDSVTFVAEPIGIITERNFSSDQRARLMVFAIGAKLGNGEQAASVTATAEDSTGTIRPLTVESARNVPNAPNFPWLTQVVMKLTDQIVPGDVKIRISVHGQTSNPVLVNLKAQ